MSSSEYEASLAALQTFTQVLADTGVSPSELTECAYYAAEPDLMRIMRLVAALNAEQRAQAYEMLSTAYPNRPAAL